MLSGSCVALNCRDINMKGWTQNESSTATVKNSSSCSRYTELDEADLSLSARRGPGGKGDQIARVLPEGYHLRPRRFMDTHRFISGRTVKRYRTQPFSGKVIVFAESNKERIHRCPLQACC